MGMLNNRVDDFKDYPVIKEIIKKYTTNNEENPQIAGAFVWNKTPEGTEFWSDVQYYSVEEVILKHPEYAHYFTTKRVIVKGVFIENGGLWKIKK